MDSPRLHAVGWAAIAATLTISLPATAQTVAPTLTTPAALSRPTLRPRYELRVQSAWPIPQGESDACNNRAFEILSGFLHRVGVNRYEGRFVRRTRLGFCGTHGSAVEACGTLLRGEGEVGVVGEIAYGPDGRPILSLVWQPVPGSTQVSIEGSCVAPFAAALERMYREAIHALDFVLPEGPDRLALEDYGRIVDIR